MLKACPELCEMVLVGAAPELSVAVGNWNVATAEDAPCAAVNKMSDGQLETTGGMESACCPRMVMVNSQEASLPDGSAKV